MFAKLALFIVIFLAKFLSQISTQSTCPVIITQNDLKSNRPNQQQPQRCKCGIKIDGSIYIFCARRNLNKLPMFIKSSILYDELILSGNSIESIRKNAFKGIKVKRLYLDDNKIVSIDNDAFIELSNYLEELVVDIDTLSSFESSILIEPPQSLFENLLNLKILKLKNFKIDRLKENLFNKTRKIESISLISSKISKLTSTTFNGIEANIREINLDDNLLGLNEANLEILFKYIKNFKRIESIVLSRNRIRRLNGLRIDDSSIVNDNSELTLDLSFNEINYIDQYAFNGLEKKIRKLILNNNELSNTQQFNFLAQLVNLKELHMDYNRISSLPENLFIKLNQLEVLSLKGNLIYELTNVNIFSGLNDNLRKLNLASNKIASIGDYVFLKTKNLRELNLERNVIKNLTKFVFNGLENELEMLNLESNLLTNDQLIVLEALKHIEYLKLGSNALKTIDQNDNRLINLFKSYHNLTYLDLSHNQFTRIPYFGHLNNTLINLMLDNNEICTVNMNNLHRSYGKLINLNLNSNKLFCDCNLLNLRNWLMTNSKLDYMHLNWRCKSGPDHLNDRLFSTIDNSQFKCNQLLPDYCDADIDLNNNNQFNKTTYLQESKLQQITNTLIKNFFIDLKNDNKISVYWELNNDNNLISNINDYYYDDNNNNNRQLNYFQISYSQMIGDKTFNNQKINLIDTSLRNYDLNEQLSYNAFYNLCFSVYYDVENYEKRCQMLKTNDFNQTKLIFSIPNHHFSINNDETAKSSKISFFNTQTKNDANLFQFETKQILYGSLIGAIIVCILIIILIFVIRSTKTKQKSKPQLPQVDKLQQKILLIRPISTINSANQDPYLHYSTSQCYTTASIEPNQMPPIDHTRASLKKKSKLNRFISFFKSNSNKSRLILEDGQTPPLNTASPQQPYLLSEVLLYPSYVISQPSSSSSTSSSSASSQNTSNLSTTFETLTTTINSNSNYQHMYHEICDTLLSNKSIKYFKPSNQLIDINQQQQMQTFPRQPRNFINFDSYCDNNNINSNQQQQLQQQHIPHDSELFI